MSKFFRVYVNGEKMNVLINADNMGDALMVASMVITDETADTVRVKLTRDDEITIGEIRSSVIKTLGGVI